MTRFLDDIFFILGIITIISTTFILNVFIGFYLIGILFVLFSFLLPNKKKKKN